MGHYDNIRDAIEDDITRKARRDAVRYACRQLASASGIKDPPDATSVARMMKLRADAKLQIAKLQAAAEMADRVFEALLINGELTVTIEDDARC